MSRKFRSIRDKLVLRIALVALLCLVVVLALSLTFLSPILAESTLKKSQQATDQMLEHLDTTFEMAANYANSVACDSELESLALAYAEDPENPQRYQQLRLKLHQFLTQFNSVRGLVLECPNGSFVTSITGICAEDLDFLESSWYAEASGSFSRNKFSDFYRIQPTSGVSSDISYAYCLSLSFKTQRFTLTVLLDAWDLLNGLDGIADGYLDDYILLSSRGTPQISLGGQEAPASEAAFLEAHTDGQTFSSQSSSNLWSVVTYLSNASINADYSLLLVCILLSYGLLCVMMLLLSRPAIGRIIAPVTQLSKTMKRVSAGDWNAKASIQTNDEIAELSTIFNDMLDNLNFYFHDSLQKEKREQQMRYNLLVSQIDPHFIYNTLSIIALLARRSNQQEIVSLNTAFISFLRDRLRIHDTDVFDTVEQEVSVLKQYINIANYRFHANPVQVEWSIEEATLGARLPKILLQTLVENCFKHAFADTDVTYHLYIAVASKGDGLSVTVIDDGFGIAPEKLAMLNDVHAVQTSARGKNIGIGHLKKILSYLYGEDFSIHFSSQPEQGTTVFLYLGQPEDSESEL